jgi:hypothetical protein
MDDERPYSARVHQASGMVAVQAMCSIADAVQLMKGRAAETGYPLDEIATGVIQRVIRFD